MAQKWANNAFSTLGGAVDDLDTSITVATNTGDRFPTAEGDEFFNLTLANAGGDVEIVKVISRAIGSDQMTVVRGQEATVPLSWSIGDIVELRPTAASFENLDERIDATEQAIEDLEFSAEAISFDDSAVSFEASNVQEAVDQLNQEVAVAAPPGVVMTFATPTVPTGWLEANGAAISRTTYSALFGAIGTTFGDGDGSTTFNLPDLRGEFLRGWDNGRGVDSGRAFGSFQADENKEHNHGGSVGSVGTHRHSVTAARENRQWRGDGFTTAGVNESFNSGSGGSHSHSLSIDNAGGNESRPRNIALLVCIKT